MVEVRRNHQNVSDRLVTATGSVTPSTLADWMAGVPRVTLIGTGVATTDTAEVQAALESLGDEGGGTLRLKGSFSVNDTIVNEYSNVAIIGDGADINHDVGTLGALASTSLIWTGAAGGTTLQFASPIGASTQKMRGGGVSGIAFQCGDNVAAKGFEVLSWNRGVFEDLYFEEFSGAGLSVGCVNTLGDARDSQGNAFRRLTSRFLTETGSCLEIDGISGANTSMNLFENIDFTHNDGNGFNLKNCDNNLFLRCRAFRAGGGTGLGVAFHGHDSSATTVARNNVFMFLTAYGITAYGTGNYTYPSYGNATLLLDEDNGVAAPTIGVGSSCSYSFPDGRIGDHALVKGISAQNATGADFARGLYTSGVSASLIIANGSEAHLQFTDNTGSVRWALVQSGTDLAASLIAGTVGAAFRAPIFKVGSGGPTWSKGTGSPESTVTAPVGSLFSRTDGGASTTLYVKESGTGNTGWRAAQTA